MKAADRGNSRIVDRSVKHRNPLDQYFGREPGSSHLAKFGDRPGAQSRKLSGQDPAKGESPDRDRQTVEVTGGKGGRLQSASFPDFIRMGVMHIFTGVAAFLVGLGVFWFVSRSYA